MQFSPLYENAVALSPRAARLAATLLVDEPALPAALRRSLVIALSACGGGDAVGLSIPREPSEGDADPDADAAWRFVEACRGAMAQK